MGFWDYFLLLRPMNCVMAGAAAWIGFAVAGGPVALTEPFLLVFLAAFFVCGGGQAVNDYFDRAVDARLHGSRPLPAGRVSPGRAFFFSLAALGAGAAAAFPLGVQPFLIALLFALLLVFYSAFLPRYKYLGNGVVAAGTAFTLVFGASAAGAPAAVAWFAAAAFFAGLARELIKDLEDVEQDRGFKVTLPMLTAPNNVKFLVLVFYAAAWAFSYAPFALGQAGALYAGIVSLANAVFLASFVLAARNRFARAQRASKLAMLLALAAFASTVAA